MAKRGSTVTPKTKRNYKNVPFALDLPLGGRLAPEILLLGGRGLYIVVAPRKASVQVLVYESAKMDGEAKFTNGNVRQDLTPRSALGITEAEYKLLKSDPTINLLEWNQDTLDELKSRGDAHWPRDFKDLLENHPTHQTISLEDNPRTPEYADIYAKKFSWAKLYDLQETLGGCRLHHYESYERWGGDATNIATSAKSDDSKSKFSVAAVRLAVPDISGISAVDALRFRKKNRRLLGSFWRTILRIEGRSGRIWEMPSLEEQNAEVARVIEAELGMTLDVWNETLLDKLHDQLDNIVSKVGYAKLAYDIILSIANGRVYEVLGHALSGYVSSNSPSAIVDHEYDDTIRYLKRMRSTFEEASD